MLDACLEKTDGCALKENLHAEGKLVTGEFQGLEAGQQELGLKAEVDLRAKAPERGLLLWYEVLRGMAELFHPQTTPPPPRPKKQQLCLTVVRSVEQTLQLDDVTVGTRGQKLRVTLGEDVCVCVCGRGVCNTLRVK